MVLVGDIVVGGRGRLGQGDGYKAEEGDGELHVGLCCLVGWSVGGWVGFFELQDVGTRVGWC